MSELNLDKCKAAFVDLSHEERKHFVEMAALIVGIKLNSEALTEHLRLKEEECKQLQQDNAELVELVESAYIEGCHDGYSEGLSDGQDYSSSKSNLEPDESWDISESKAKLEKHKCD